MTVSWRCIAVHAERLEDGVVWTEIRRLLDATAERSTFTFFVSPVHAIWAGTELEPRLRELHDRGHEIAQHTHYYDLRTDPNGPGGGEALLTPDNVVGCLDRDRRYLDERGFPPAGFVSGAWALTPEIDAWLHDPTQGLRYDTSWRTYRLPYESPGARAGDERRPEVHRGLVRLPTTGGLRDSLRGPRQVGSQVGPYEQLYLHDYDLRDRTKRLALRAVLAVRRRARVVAAGQLAEQVRAATGGSNE